MPLMTLHRALARAVRTDDGADLMFEHVEGDVRQRLHAAETQRNRRKLEDRRAKRKSALRRLQDRGLHGGRHVHATLRICAGATTFASRIFTSSASSPKRTPAWPPYIASTSAR